MDTFTRLYGMKEDDTEVFNFEDQRVLVELTSNRDFRSFAAFINRPNRVWAWKDLDLLIKSVSKFQHGGAFQQGDDESANTKYAADIEHRLLRMKEDKAEVFRFENQRLIVEINSEDEFNTFLTFTTRPSRVWRRKDDVAYLMELLFNFEIEGDKGSHIVKETVSGIGDLFQGSY